MIVAQTLVFGLSVTELAIVGAIVGWVVSQFRDFRPIKALREENRGLRADLGKANDKIHELEQQVRQLKRATDVSAIDGKQDATIELLQELVKEVKFLDGSVRANTAAVETLSKRRIIDEALNEGGRAA